MLMTPNHLRIYFSPCARISFPLSVLDVEMADCGTEGLAIEGQSQAKWAVSRAEETGSVQKSWGTSAVHAVPEAVPASGIPNGEIGIKNASAGGRSAERVSKRYAFSRAITEKVRFPEPGEEPIEKRYETRKRDFLKELRIMKTDVVISASELNEFKKASSMEGVLPQFHERWSPRSFANREVSRELLRKAFEAARWTASSFNEQPWRFLLGRRPDETYTKIFDSLGDFNKKWAWRAPVLILGATKAKSSRNGADNRVALFDLGAASSYLTLEATALGLATHQMEGFDTEKVRKAFGIPADYLMGSVIALGYQGEPAALEDDQLVDRETSARTRKGLSEIVLSAWDQPADI
jgi:nitroreductase